jgi:hypothetical protein
LTRKKVETCENSAIGAEFVVFHDLLVVEETADVEVGVEGSEADSRVEVGYVGKLLSGGEEVVLEALMR